MVPIYQPGHLRPRAPQPGRQRKARKGQVAAESADRSPRSGRGSCIVEPVDATFAPRTVPAPGGCEITDRLGVDVWFATLDLTRDDSASASALSRDETLRAGRMAAIPRRRFVASRALLRRLLAAYLSCGAAEVGLSYGSNGKPVLAPTGRSNGLHFNLSHAGHRALFAFSRNPVGVDVEAIRPLRDLNALSARFFSERERRTLAELPAESRQRAFFACWTRKEACVKAMGTGIANRLDSFAVSFDPRSEPAVLGPDGTPDPDWTVRHLEPERDVVGALAANQPECSLRCWQVAVPEDGPAHEPSPSMKLVS